MISAHSYGIRRLAEDLDRAREQILPEVEKTTGMACRKIQLDVRKRWRGMAHLPALPRSITYEVRREGSTVVGECGAEHERLQGKLAVYLEYGSPTSAPHPAFRPATEAELPAWTRFLEQAATDALGWKD